MKLILVRHGETRLNKAGRVQGINAEPLNVTGRAQARVVSTALAYDQPFHLYASPLARAIETAQTTSDAHHVPLATLDDIREADVGDLDGMTIPEIRERYPGFMERWATDSGNAQMPGGESLAQLQERVWQVAQTLLGRHLEDSVVVVSHNFPIETLVCRVLELPLAGIRRMRVDLGSLSTVDMREDRRRLVHLNDICHLEGIDDSPGR
ncbi:MAG: histidine phosphatase family protein [Chloroflexi bacterium]|nr:histidine phosphatase family protein [Chloroflexota bacterium]